MKKIVALVSVLCMASVLFSKNTVVCILDEGVCELVSQSGQVVLSTPIYSGSFDGPKDTLGDMKSPWGKYHAGILLDYPNSLDRAYGCTGDGIMVHDGQFGSKPSVGCIAVLSMKDLLVIHQEMLQGSGVYIFPSRFTYPTKQLWSTLLEPKYAKLVLYLYAEYQHIYHVVSGNYNYSDPTLFQCNFALQKEYEAFAIPKDATQAPISFVTHDGKTSLCFSGIGIVSIDSIVWSDKTEVTKSHSRQPFFQMTCIMKDAFFDSMTFVSNRTGKVFLRTYRIKNNLFKYEADLETVEGIYALRALLSKCQLATSCEPVIPKKRIMYIQNKYEALRLTDVEIHEDTVTGQTATGEFVTFTLSKSTSRFFSSNSYIVYQSSSWGSLRKLIIREGNTVQASVRAAGADNLFYVTKR
jgi:hypothetical protein